MPWKLASSKKGKWEIPPLFGAYSGMRPTLQARLQSRRPPVSWSVPGWWYWVRAATRAVGEKADAVTARVLRVCSPGLNWCHGSKGSHGSHSIYGVTTAQQNNRTTAPTAPTAEASRGQSPSVADLIWYPFRCWSRSLFLWKSALALVVGSTFDSIRLTRRGVCI